MAEELALILFLGASRRTVTRSEDKIVLVEVPDHNEIEVLVRLPQEQVLPQFVDFRAELFMTGVLQKKLIEDFEAHLFWRGIQSLDYRCISLLW